MTDEESERRDMRTQPAIAGFKDRKGAMSQGMWWPLGAGNGPQLTARKKTGTVVLQSQGIEFHK